MRLELGSLEIEVNEETNEQDLYIDGVNNQIKVELGEPITVMDLLHSADQIRSRQIAQFGKKLIDDNDPMILSIIQDNAAAILKDMPVLAKNDISTAIVKYAVQEVVAQLMGFTLYEEHVVAKPSESSSDLQSADSYGVEQADGWVDIDNLDREEEYV